MKYYGVCDVDPQKATFDRNQARHYSKFQYRKCIHFIRMSSSFASDSLIDIFSVVPAFGISLIVPSRTIIVLAATLKRIVLINGPECQPLAPTAERDYHHECCNNQESQSLKMQESRLELRVVSRLNMISSLIDVLAIPLGLVGYLAYTALPLYVRYSLLFVLQENCRTKIVYAGPGYSTEIMNLHFFAQYICPSFI